MSESQSGFALPAGVLVGHWSHPAAKTGCTVILSLDGAVAGVDVRGGAPGTLNTDALRCGTSIPTVNAVLLTGGSAFGLEAAFGVMRYLEEQGKGFAIGPVRIPGVVGAVIFDLLVGDPRVRPDARAGYEASRAASGRPASGAVGAGTGASVAKAGDRSQTAPGGVGVASVRAGDVTVAAIMVVNAVGGIWDDERSEWVAPLDLPASLTGLLSGGNTTIGCVVTDATLTKEQANRVAMVSHDGIARAVRPAHTLYDGDAIFCLATGAVPGAYDAVELAAAKVVARAIAAGVRAARGG
jgi:L-aminopeptidase/D-esterase-like protein